jgi:hypothetical protein
MYYRICTELPKDKVYCLDSAKVDFYCASQCVQMNNWIIVFCIYAIIAHFCVDMNDPLSPFMTALTLVVNMLEYALCSQYISLHVL